MVFGVGGAVRGVELPAFSMNGLSVVALLLEEGSGALLVHLCFSLNAESSNTGFSGRVMVNWNLNLKGDLGHMFMLHASNEMSPAPNAAEWLSHAYYDSKTSRAGPRPGFPRAHCAP